MNNSDKKYRFIISPFSRKLMLFNFLTCNLVVYDCIMVPFKNTFGSKIFDDNTKRILDIVDSTIKFIFAIDVILCFRKAYLNEKNGSIIRDPVKIAQRYLMFYFWIDLISAIPFDLFVDSGLLRYSSLVKVFRLLRLETLVSYLDFGVDTRAKIRIFYLISSLIMIIHWTTCYFYFIVGLHRRKELFSKLMDRYASDFWMPQVDLNDQKTDFYKKSDLIKYIIVSYYALLLIIGNDIMAQTEEEIVFSCFLLILGAFVEATVFGGLASEMQCAISRE